MKTSIKKIENSIVEMTIEETKENIAKFRKKAIDKIRESADIKGFRKGSHIPEEIIIKNYSPEYINSIVIDEALNVLYAQGLKKNNLIPVSQGEIKEIISQDPLIVVMSIEVFPEVEITGDYKTIKLNKTIVEVNDDELDSALNEIQNKFSQFEIADQEYLIKNGDRVEITTQGFDLDGIKLENTNMENYPLVIGSNVLVPGFENGLIGKKINDDITLDIVFPDDYHNDFFKGKKTKFNVKIGKIEKSVKPEFTPEFIKDLRGKDLDLQGFKELIKEELLETKESNSRLEDENKLMDELLKIVTVDLGTALLKNQINKVFNEIKENISKNGAKPLDYISSLGLDEEQYIEQYVKPIAIKRLQAELILHKLLELEKIEPTQDEIDLEISKIIAKFESEDVVRRLKELYKVGSDYYAQLVYRISYKKLIDSFFI